MAVSSGAIQQELGRTYSVGGEQARGSQCTDVAASLNDVDGVDVVGIDDPGAAQSAHDLGEDVRRDLAPGEVPECRECNGHCGVDVTSGNA